MLFVSLTIVLHFEFCAINVICKESFRSYRRNKLMGFSSGTLRLIFCILHQDCRHFDFFAQVFTLDGEGRSLIAKATFFISVAFILKVVLKFERRPGPSPSQGRSNEVNKPSHERYLFLWLGVILLPRGRNTLGMNLAITLFKKGRQ